MNNNNLIIPSIASAKLTHTHTMDRTDFLFLLKWIGYVY